MFNCAALFNTVWSEVAVEELVSKKSLHPLMRMIADEHTPIFIALYILFIVQILIND